MKTRGRAEDGGGADAVRRCPLTGVRLAFPASTRVRTLVASYQRLLFLNTPRLTLFNHHRYIKHMITSTTVIRVRVGGVVGVLYPPSHFNNQIFIEKDPDFMLSSNESNDPEDNLSSFTTESVETTAGIVSDPGGCFVARSDSDLFHQRTFYKVTSDGSCRAHVEKSIPQKISLASSPPYVSQGVPPWVHVFAKSTASSSLRTQCASIAHNLPTIYKFCQEKNENNAQEINSRSNSNYSMRSPFPRINSSLPSRKLMMKSLFLMGVMLIIPPYYHPMSAENRGI